MKDKKTIIVSLCTLAVIAIGFNTINQKDNQNMKENIISSEEKKFYGTFETTNSWFADPAQPQNLLKVTENNAIIKIKVEAIEKPLFLDNKGDFREYRPYTPIKVKIEKVISGQFDKNIETIYILGGDVTISSLMKTIDDDTIKKMEFDTLTQEEQNNLYISYKSDYDYDLQIGEEYACIVSKNGNDTYTIIASGYGVFKKDSTKSVDELSSFKNVITNNDLTDMNGIVLKLK